MGETITGSELQNTQTQSIKSEWFDVDYVKIGLNPAVLIVLICVLLYSLWRAHWDNKSKY